VDKPLTSIEQSDSARESRTAAHGSVLTPDQSSRALRRENLGTFNLMLPDLANYVHTPIGSRVRCPTRLHTASVRRASTRACIGAFRRRRSRAHERWSNGSHPRALADGRAFRVLTRRRSMESLSPIWLKVCQGHAVAEALDRAIAKYGDFAGAEAKLQETANQRVPHWADPLKAWGDIPREARAREESTREIR